MAPFDDGVSLHPPTKYRMSRAILRCVTGVDPRIWARRMAGDINREVRNIRLRTAAGLEPPGTEMIPYCPPGKTTAGPAVDNNNDGPNPNPFQNPDWQKPGPGLYISGYPAWMFQQGQPMGLPGVYPQGPLMAVPGYYQQVSANGVPIGMPVPAHGPPIPPAPANDAANVAKGTPESEGEAGKGRKPKKPDGPAGGAAGSGDLFIAVHVCRACGNARSPGFHRDHPLVPGLEIEHSNCGRCERMKDLDWYTDSESGVKFRKNKGKGKGKEVEEPVEEATTTVAFKKTRRTKSAPTKGHACSAGQTSHGYISEDSVEETIISVKSARPQPSNKKNQKAPEKGNQPKESTKVPEKELHSRHVEKRSLVVEDGGSGDSAEKGDSDYEEIIIQKRTAHPRPMFPEREYGPIDNSPRRGSRYRPPTGGRSQASTLPRLTPIGKSHVRDQTIVYRPRTPQDFQIPGVRHLPAESVRFFSPRPSHAGSVRATGRSNVPPVPSPPTPPRHYNRPSPTSHTIQLPGLREQIATRSMSSTTSVLLAAHAQRQERTMRKNGDPLRLVVDLGLAPYP